MDQESEGTSLVIFVVGGVVLLLLLLGGGVAFFFLASSEVMPEAEMPFVDEPPKVRVHEAEPPVPDDVPQHGEKVERLPVQQSKDHNPEQPAPPPAPKK